VNDDEAGTRVATLERYQVLDRPQRRELVALLELAARVSGVSMATVNLLTDVAQHQVATVGFEGGVCSYDDSMCAEVVESGRAVVTEDASEDDRFRDNPFVTGRLGDVRFYASHPLTTPEGVTVGTLCVFDDQPRRISAQDAGALATLAGQVVDVLELELRSRQLEAALSGLRAANQQLETSNERLAAFAGQVSHDLKNPLTALGMSLGLLEEELEDSGALDDAGLAQLLKRAGNGATRMETMIDDLLSFARTGGSPALQPVDLAAVTADAVTDLDGALPPGSVTVGDLPVVLGDPTQVRLVMQNLLSNAGKFVVDDQPAQVAVSASDTGDGWRVEVADRGRGVPEADRQRVFEPLARLDKRVPGNGIGLATCRRIISAHAGRIGLDERPGGGTIAWFELPGRA
jgi:signal transduction histidine kinase